jgi:hypothetical protein
MMAEPFLQLAARWPSVEDLARTCDITAHERELRGDCGNLAKFRGAVLREPAFRCRDLAETEEEASTKRPGSRIDRRVLD